MILIYSSIDSEGLVSDSCQLYISFQLVTQLWHWPHLFVLVLICCHWHRVHPYIHSASHSLPHSELLSSSWHPQAHV